MIGGLMKTTSRFAIAAAASVLATSAMAADLGGNCCADLEERVSELEATTARKGNRKVSLEISGWVSQQVMFWDDGRESNVYVGQNTATASRFRLVGSAKIDARWSAGYLLEFGVYSGPSHLISQGPTIADDPMNVGPTTTGTAAGNWLQLRHSAWWIDNKDLGRLWVGQTGQATDAIALINLANTTVAGAHTKTSLNDASFRLRTSANVPSTTINEPIGMSAVTWGNARISGHGNPGDGDRLQVVKYVSPTLHGFIFSTAWGEDDMWDVSLKYANEFNGVRVAAGIGYQQLTDGNADGGNGILGCANARAAAAVAGTTNNRNDVDCSGWAASGSIMHVPTGLYLTAAGGSETDNMRNVVAQQNNRALGVKSTDSWWYLQGGIERNWFGIGKTTLYGEYHNVSGGTVPVTIAAGVNAADPINSFGAAARIHSTEVATWGLGMVQAVDAAAMDLFISYRTREADLTLKHNVTGALQASRAIEDLQILSVGGMIKF